MNFRGVTLAQLIELLKKLCPRAIHARSAIHAEGN